MVIMDVLMISVGLIATGSWDKFIKLWDPRTNQCTGKYEQPEKVSNLNLILHFRII